jgi:outer membrane protein OmpA-like peptidoglycan-associated protein
MYRILFLSFLLLFTSDVIAQRISSTHFFYFESSSEKLNSVEEKKLLAVCDTLSRHKLVSVSVTGHTDDTNGEEENMTLSELRAKSIKEILVKNGIPENIISLAAMGESIPLETNSTEKGKARNRRAEVKVVYD